jgi:hypothetical protein
VVAALFSPEHALMPAFEAGCQARDFDFGPPCGPP